MDRKLLKSASLGQTVGILGGGQLARMLAEAAFRMGLRPIPLALTAGDPAAQLCPGAVFGKLDDRIALERLFAQVELVTFENEFVPCDLLEEAARNSAERGRPVRFLPSLAAIRCLQDKLFQKKELERLGIASAPYEVLPAGAPIEKWCREMMERFNAGVVFKWARMGYDGHGTWISRGDDLAGATAFCEKAARKGVPVYAEQKVEFEREVAIVASHSIEGEFAAYPLVVSEQRGGVCRSVRGPAEALGIAPEISLRAKEIVRSIAAGIAIEGTFAAELFLTPESELWVNELAPRVHNTGHYTQDAARTSQFENHWRAVIGLRLGSTECTPGFAMLNLLGPAEVSASGPGLPLPEPPWNGHLHWYGKSELRAGRKLGHLNAVGSSASEVENLLASLEECERSWVQKLQGAELQGEG